MVHEGPPQPAGHRLPPRDRRALRRRARPRRERRGQPTHQRRQRGLEPERRRRLQPGRSHDRTGRNDPAHLAVGHGRHRRSFGCHLPLRRQVAQLGRRARGGLPRRQPGHRPATAGDAPQRPGDRAQRPTRRRARNRRAAADGGAGTRRQPLRRHRRRRRHRRDLARSFPSSLHLVHDTERALEVLLGRVARAGRRPGGPAHRGERVRGAEPRRPRRVPARRCRRPRPAHLRAHRRVGRRPARRPVARRVRRDRGRTGRPVPTARTQLVPVRVRPDRAALRPPGQPRSLRAALRGAQLGGRRRSPRRARFPQRRAGPARRS